MRSGIGQKSVRIFISNTLVKLAEEMSERKDGRGRPTSHSTCLILAMIAVKSLSGLGYRETERLFLSRGYTKLPNFRTVQWRSDRLKRNNLGIILKVAEKDGEYEVLVDTSHTKKFLSKSDVSSRVMDKNIKSLDNDFVELLI